MTPADWIRRYPLFGLLPPEQFDSWLSSGRVQDVGRGETIFQEGLPGEWVYLVLEGRVRVVRRSKSGEAFLGILKQAEVFGEFALVPPCHNTATCRTTNQVRLFVLPLQPLRTLLAGLPGVLPNLKNWLRLHALLAYLREQTFLGFMSAPSALSHLDHLQPATFPAQHTIQAEGLSDDCLFFIESGEVSLENEERPGEPPRRLGAGDCFGERALAGHIGLPVAVARTDIRCQVLPRDRFDDRSAHRLNVSRQSIVAAPPSLVAHFRWVGQQEAADCGVASLAMLAQSLGLDASPAHLRPTAVVGPTGATLQEMQRLAGTIGLRAVAARVGADQLPRVALPAVAHYRNGHYVVLYEVSANGVVVGDPMTGLLRMAHDEFTQAWSGNLLLVNR